MKSIWQKNCIIDKRPSLQHDLETDVAIIGAGISGLLIAEKLKEKGIKSVLIEANRIGSGQSGKSTAKISAQHDLIYQKLIQDFDLDQAKQYALMNLEAITDYEKLIFDQHIECDFQRTTSTLYTKKQDKMIQDEINSARLCGLDPFYDDHLSLPFETSCGITLKNQAQFDPMQFMKAISEKHEIYEKTKVTQVKDNTIFTESHTIQAQKIVFACHFPFINFPGLYFARMHQSRTSCLALDHTSKLDGCFLSIDEDGLSFRNSKYGLIFGGMSHRCGEKMEKDNYIQLSETAQSIFPYSSIICNWSAQDCMTLDHVPYIGQYAASRPDWYVATGYNKWGMTTAMVAAKIISQMIFDHDENKTIFNPNRFNSASISPLIQNSISAAKGLALENLTLPEDSISKLPIGHGGIINIHEQSYGVYKKSEEEIYIVSSRCPHLGCQLTWNPNEKTWDCPCHGSRFDYKGNLIDGPAQISIKIDDFTEF